MLDCKEGLKSIPQELAVLLINRAPLVDNAGCYTIQGVSRCEEEVEVGLVKTKLYEQLRTSRLVNVLAGGKGFRK